MKLNQRLFAIGVFAGAMAFASTSVPGIVSVTHLSGAGFSTADGTFTRTAPSNTNLGGATGISLNQPQIWFERTLLVPDIASAGGTRVDWLGTADSLGVAYGVTSSASTGGAVAGPVTAFNTTRVLAAGRNVNSYYLYSNRNNASADPTYAASIVFNQPIVGIIVNNGTGVTRLNLTNADYGRTGVTNYNTATSYGWEGSTDRLKVEQVTPTQYKLTFQLTNNGFDSFRILTATPEPATWAAFGLIAIALFVAARRHRAVANQA